MPSLCRRLGAAAFTAQVCEDGATPTALKASSRGVKASDVLTLKLAPSGGGVVRIAPAG